MYWCLLLFSLVLWFTWVLFCLVSWFCLFATFVSWDRVSLHSFDYLWIHYVYTSQTQKDQPDISSRGFVMFCASNSPLFNHFLFKHGLFFSMTSRVCLSSCSIWRIPSSTFCRAVLVAVDSFNFFIKTWKYFFIYNDK